MMTMQDRIDYIIRLISPIDSNRPMRRCSRSAYVMACRTLRLEMRAHKASQDLEWCKEELVIESKYFDSDFSTSRLIKSALIVREADIERLRLEKRAHNALHGLIDAYPDQAIAAILAARDTVARWHDIVSMEKMEKQYATK